MEGKKSGEGTEGTDLIEGDKGMIGQHLGRQGSDHARQGTEELVSKQIQRLEKISLATAAAS